MDGLAATREITGDVARPGFRVLVLTTFEIDEYVFAALGGRQRFPRQECGAGELQEAIRVVARGDALLSPVATRRLITRFLGGRCPARPCPRTWLCSPSANVK